MISLSLSLSPKRVVGSPLHMDDQLVICHTMSLHGCKVHVMGEITYRVAAPITDHLRDDAPNLEEYRGGAIFSRVGR